MSRRVLGLGSFGLVLFCAIAGHAAKTESSAAKTTDAARVQLPAKMFDTEYFFRELYWDVEPTRPEPGEPCPPYLFSVETGKGSDFDGEINGYDFDFENVTQTTNADGSTESSGTFDGPGGLDGTMSTGTSADKSKNTGKISASGQGHTLDVNWTIDRCTGEIVFGTGSKVDGIDVSGTKGTVSGDGSEKKPYTFTVSAAGKTASVKLSTVDGAAIPLPLGFDERLASGRLKPSRTVIPRPPVRNRPVSRRPQGYSPKAGESPVLRQ
jgi:hypothetical protein